MNEKYRDNQNRLGDIRSDSNIADNGSASVIGESAVEANADGVAYCRIIYERGLAIDFQYLFVNSQFERLTQLKNVVGKTASDVVPGIFTLHPGLLKTYDRVARLGQEQNFEIFVPGLQKWLSIRAIRPEMGHFLAIFGVSSEQGPPSQELALVDAEHFALYESDLIGTVVFDGTSIARCNAAFSHMFGYDDNELVGSSAKILFNDDDAFDEFSDQLSAGQQDGQTRRIYTCQRHKDGSRRYSKISYRPPFKGSNLIVGVFIDITEKRLSQARLRDVSKQLELILEASELGTWDWDVVSGSMTVNERWCAMLGMEAFPAEVTVATWCERVHPADLEGVMAAYKCHYEGNTAFYETEHRLRHNDGHWVWVLSHGKVVSRGQNNQPLRAAGTHLDISHRKRIESESFSLLAQMEQLIRQIVPARAQVPLSPSLTKDLASYGLSKRQQQILAKVVNGQRSTEIALELGISKSTVVTHRRDVMRKLKIRTMAELTRFAIRNGIMES